MVRARLFWGKCGDKYGRVFERYERSLRDLLDYFESEVPEGNLRGLVYTSTMLPQGIVDMIMYDQWYEEEKGRTEWY